MPAASARAMAPIPGLLATTWTTSAPQPPARMRSIRFCSVVPPPETQTARRIGGSMIGGVRGVSLMAELPPASARMGCRNYDPGPGECKFR